MNQVSSKPVVSAILLPDFRTEVTLHGDDIHVTQHGTAPADRIKAVVITRPNLPTFLQAFLALYDQYQPTDALSDPQLRRTPEGLRIYDAAGVGVLVPRAQLDAFFEALLALTVNNYPVAAGGV